MSAPKNPDAVQNGRSGRAVLAALVYSVLFVLLLLQITSEGLQVALALLADFGFGYLLGHLLRGRSRSTLAFWGAGIGLLTWAAIIVVSLVFFPGAAAYPIFTWFVRFGLGGALCITGGALFGDLAARQQLAATTASLATVVSIAGGLVTILTPFI